MEDELYVTVTDLIEKMNLVNHTPEIDTDKILIKDPNMNRPAVQLAGFFEHFDAARIQICGNVEYAYIANMHTREENIEIFDKMFAFHIPCLIFCRNLQPYDFIIEEGKKFGVPILTDRSHMCPTARKPSPTANMQMQIPTEQRPLQRSVRSS